MAPALVSDVSMPICACTCVCQYAHTVVSVSVHDLHLWRWCVVESVMILCQCINRDGCLPCHSGCGVIANMYVYMYVSVHMLY